MSVRTGIIGSLAFLACLAGDPGNFSLLPGAANAASVSRIVCSSTGYRYSYCPINTRGGVQLSSRLSKSGCKFGRSWGYDGGGVWVDNGCSAEFLVSRSGRSGSGDLGGLIVGGVVGALLANGGRDNHRGDNYYSRPRPRQNDRWIDPTPQFDRDGNPNFDTHGRYQGCHGVGCVVDNPDDYADAPPEPGQTTFEGPDDDE